MSASILFYQVDENTVVNLQNVISITSDQHEFFKCRNPEDDRLDIFEKLNALIILAAKDGFQNTIYIKDEDGSKFQKMLSAIFNGGWGI